MNELSNLYINTLYLTAGNSAARQCGNVLYPSCRQVMGVFALTLGNAKDVMTDEQIKIVMWRINIQVIAMQMGDYKIAISNEERILWKSRILESLLRLNEKAQKINAAWPLDLPAPTAEYAALSVAGNWCDTLTRELTCLFSSAPDADIMRIE